MVLFAGATTDRRARLDSRSIATLGLYRSRPTRWPRRAQDWQEWSRDQFEIQLALSSGRVVLRVTSRSILGRLSLSLSYKGVQRHYHRVGSHLDREIQRKMNFTYVLGFVVLKDVVKVFPFSSSSFARKTIGRNRARSHSGAWRGLKTKWDLKLSLPSPTYFIWY